MANNRVELDDMVLEGVAGGNITFTRETATTGRVGINGNYNYSYDNYDAMYSYVAANYAKYSIDERDDALINGMLAAGIIH